MKRPSPLAGKTEAEVLEWYAAPPSRLEIYAVLVQLSTLGGFLVGADTAIFSNDRKDALDNIRGAFDALREVMSQLPEVDEAVKESLRSGKPDA